MLSLTMLSVWCCLLLVALTLECRSCTASLPVACRSLDAGFAQSPRWLRMQRRSVASIKAELSLTLLQRGGTGEKYVTWSPTIEKRVGDQRGPDESWRFVWTYSKTVGDRGTRGGNNGVLVDYPQPLHPLWPFWVLHYIALFANVCDTCIT